MALKLYMDHDSGNRAVVAALRSASIDILTTTESGRHRESDEDQLAFATSQRRVIYTANSGDFARLHREWLRSGRHHSGMVLRANQRLGVGDQVRGLLRIADAFGSADTEDLFTYLDIWLAAGSS